MRKKTKKLFRRLDKIHNIAFILMAVGFIIGFWSDIIGLALFIIGFIAFYIATNKYFKALGYKDAQDGLRVETREVIKKLTKKKVIATVLLLAGIIILNFLHNLFGDITGTLFVVIGFIVFERSTYKIGAADGYDKGYTDKEKGRDYFVEVYREDM